MVSRRYREGLLFPNWLWEYQTARYQPLPYLLIIDLQVGSREGELHVVSVLYLVEEVHERPKDEPVTLGEHAGAIVELRREGWGDNDEIGNQGGNEKGIKNYASKEQALHKCYNVK